MANYTISLSGLQSTSRALDTVSNNIANSNTYGYKAGEYVFADQFIRAINPADQSRVGLGVQNTMVRRSNIQGTIVASANQLDLAINGQGMFRLLQSSGIPGEVDPSAVFYSRNGQFMVNKEGYIVNSSGMYLTGFQPTADKTGISDDTIANNGLLKLPGEYMPGVATTRSTVTALVDSRSDAYTPQTGVPFDPQNSASYNNKTTQTIFDNEGAAHTLELYYRRTGDRPMEIVNTSQGYIYTPSPSSTVNLSTDASLTNSGRQVVLNRDSVLRMETAPLFKELADADTTNNTVILRSNVGTGPAAQVTPGMRIYVNGVDTGLEVGSGAGDVDVTTTPGKTIITTASGNLSIPANSEVSFYSKYEIRTGTATLPATTTAEMTADSIGIVGYRVLVGGVDTGAHVVSVAADNKTLTFDKPIATSSTGGAFEFRPVNSMTLVTPDGTRVSVQGTTNQKGLANPTKLYANMATVMVYGALNGRFFNNPVDTSVTTNPEKIFTESPATGGVNGPYKAVLEMNFVGGRNIDSLVTDNRSGSPLFRTSNNLYAEVTNQAGGPVYLDFELDMTDTTLQAGAFQITRNVQNGEPLSRLTNVAVDTQGRIVATYGSGKQLYVGQVALVHFDAFEGLIPVGNNTFAASIDSGTEQTASTVLVGKAGTGIFGDIKAQALESSNVDLANELVRLLILQRSYTANSQGLRAFDSTLQDTLRIIG
jgi:flagellar hook protein FlgE